MKKSILSVSICLVLLVALAMPALGAAADRIRPNPSTAGAG